MSSVADFRIIDINKLEALKGVAEVKIIKGFYVDCFKGEFRVSSQLIASASRKK